MLLMLFQEIGRKVLVRQMNNEYFSCFDMTSWNFCDHCKNNSYDSLERNVVFRYIYNI